MKKIKKDCPSENAHNDKSAVFCCPSENVHSKSALFWYKNGGRFDFIGFLI